MTNNSKKYLIHVWNADGSTTGVSELVDVLEQFLSNNKWNKTEQSDDASMVVLMSLDLDIRRLSVADARVFLSVLGGGQTGRVLFIHPGVDIQDAPSWSCDWLFTMGILEEKEKWGALEKWLSNEENTGRGHSIAIEEVYSKFLEEIGENGGKPEEDQKRLEIVADIYKKAGSYDYDRVEHDIYSRIDRLRQSGNRQQGSKNIGATIGNSFLEKVLVDDWRALWNGLCYAIPFDHERRVLLIDDKPEEYRDKILKVADIFKTQMKVDVLNTSKGSNLENIWELASYRSFDSSVHERTVVISNSEGKEKSVCIGEIFKNYHTLLVDLLMPGPSGVDEIIGIDLIRGLRRLAIDRYSDDDKSDIPDIIALSMADDVEKVQAAMRYGAEAYVFKPRLMSLLGVLGYLGEPPLSRVINNRRNFRSLYRLPAATQRVLKNTRVMPVRFDRAPDQLSKDEIATRDRNLGLAKKLARLLQRLPKTDLHVHVGSCMSPEFLITASAVMLLRHKDLEKVSKSFDIYKIFWSGDENIKFVGDLNIKPTENDFSFINEGKGIHELAIKVREYLRSCLKDQDGNDASGAESLRLFRSILHKEMGVPSHWTEDRAAQAIDSKPDIDIFLFLLSNGELADGDGPPAVRGCDDIIRFFLLYQAANHEGYGGKCTFILNGQDKNRIDVLPWFKTGKFDEGGWIRLHEAFYPSREHDSKDMFTILGNDGWRLPRNGDLVRCEVTLGRRHDGVLDDLPGFGEDPISWLLATGTRCGSLLEYLEGCEFSGAEHLRHPWLIHLYAQQAVWQFANMGLMYVELRAAVSGYENLAIGFHFRDACACMAQAFENAAKAIKGQCHKGLRRTDSDHGFNDWLWLNEQESLQSSSPMAFPIDSLSPFFPVKVGLTLTGKRHKPVRQMLREISAAVVFQSPDEDNLISARDFVHKEITKCRFVGFDLAGPEEAFPPELFDREFEQVSRMHIPITVHSGENAPPRFVENAVIDLGAKRIGHGLSMAEDRALMNRLRNDRVCIELCPSSNFQTNHLVQHGAANGRPYPIVTYLENGNAICINTDNPIISYTNIVKEYFMASWACGEKGISLWNLLRIIRMGFVHSFLSVPDCRAMIQLADQEVFDILMDKELIDCLRSISEQFAAK